MIRERRSALRVPIQIYMTQYVDDRPHRCFTVDLSASGIHVEKLIEPIARRTSIIQVELPLPGGDVVWAKGRIAYDSFDPYFHGMGVRFLAMAKAHRKMLHEYVHDTYLSWGRLPSC